ncbi:MAG: alpha/beta hydrolase [Pseudomonadota bacterium]
MSFDRPQMIDLGEVELEVFTFGERTSPDRAVMLCHGWPEHAFSWRHQIEPLVAAGYHVIVPNQRGYGRSSAPEAVADYSIRHLTNDLAALLDHFEYEQAVLVGHDWGAIVVWNFALLQPQRLKALANLSVPFMQRFDTEWVTLWEQMLGPDFYIVHFNRQPGVADAVFDTHREQFLRNMYRTRQWEEPAPELGEGMPLIRLAERTEPMPGIPLMSDDELAVFANAFAHSGFRGGINWYRNLPNNWALLADVPQTVPHPALMIHGSYDIVPPSATLKDHVPAVEVHTLPCGHWIQQECPEETNQLLLDWLSRL